MIRLLSLGLAALVVIGCSVLPTGGSRPLSTESARGPSPSSTSATPSARSSIGASIPLCDDVPYIAAPAEHYRDTPIYVANEMPTDGLRAWASGKPGFEELWIDRDHHGWVTLAFSQAAEARQAELEAEFPDVGAVAVQVDWTMAELEALQQRVRPLMPELVNSSGIPVNKGVVSIGIGPLTAERIATVEEHFAGEPVCLEGIDPALLPPDGPQQLAGDGWRLLADADGIGPAYRTGIAFDEASYAELWHSAELEGERPPVDFHSEVAIWFGVVTGSSCPNIRLDDVVVDSRSALVYAEIVNLEFGVCTDDIHPHAYVVAFERSRLPRGPFWVQLGADSPPDGVREERTIVEVDLSVPGSVAAPGEVHPDTSEPEPYFVGPGDFIENDYPFEYRQSTHCGLEWLGPLNDANWRTAEAAGEPDWIPAGWSDSVVDGQVELEVLLTVDPPRLEATADGQSVTYAATADQPPGCD